MPKLMNNESKMSERHDIEIHLIHDDQTDCNEILFHL